MPGPCWGAGRWHTCLSTPSSCTSEPLLAFVFKALLSSKSLLLFVCISFLCCFSLLSFCCIFVAASSLLASSVSFFQFILSTCCAMPSPSELGDARQVHVSLCAVPEASSSIHSLIFHDPAERSSASPSAISPALRRGVMPCSFLLSLSLLLFCPLQLGKVSLPPSLFTQS